MYAIETNGKSDKIKRNWYGLPLEFNTSLTDGKPHCRAPLTSLEILPLCQILEPDDSLTRSIDILPSKRKNKKTYINPWRDCYLSEIFNNIESNVYKKLDILLDSNTSISKNDIEDVMHSAINDEPLSCNIPKAYVNKLRYNIMRKFNYSLSMTSCSVELPE